MNKSRLIAVATLSMGLIFVVASLLLTLPALAQDGGEDSQPEPSGDNSYCLVCHQASDKVVTLPDGYILELQFNADISNNFAHGLHTAAEIGLGCVDCHVDAFPHVQPLPNTHAQYVTKFTDACLECHGQENESGERVFHIANLQESDLLEDTVCYDCHVSGYNEVAPDPSVLTVAVETCADCHATTVSEWEQSLHGEQQLGCNTCHYPHEGKLRFETTEALCLNCHDQDRDNYVHLQHVEQVCADCHVYRGGDRTTHIMAEVSLPTGHDNKVGIAACLDCHEDLEVEANQDIVAALDEHPVLEAQEQIEALEAEIETKRDDSQSVVSVRLVQGIVLGLALGALIVFGVTRYFKVRREFD